MSSRAKVVPTVELEERADGVVTLAQLKRDALEWASGWYNERTGAGDPTRDKLAGAQWVGGVRLHPRIAMSLFAFNDLARTIVSALPEWALRHGWTLAMRADPANAEEGSAFRALPPSMRTEDLRMRVEAELQRLDVHEAQRQAATWGQLYGGGLILLGCADGGDSAEELDLDSLEALEYLRVVERAHVQITQVDADPNSAMFGEAVQYRVQRNVGAGGGVVAELWHHSRVIRYPGVLTPHDLRVENEMWDHGKLEHTIAQLKRTDGVWDNVGAMVADGSQGVWKIKGLFQAVVSGKRQQIEDRFTIADKARSMFRSLLLDADQEGFEYVHRQFGGIDGILAQSAIRTAAAAQMPVTVLYGQSPAGLNATGESDIRLWYDRVEQYQTDVILPGLRRILELMFASRNGPTKGRIPEGWRVTMNPVRKATPMEQGELAARQSQVDAAYIEANVLSADEVAVSRFTPHGYSTETHIDVELRRRALLAAHEAGLSPTPAPEPTPAPAPGPTPGTPPEPARGDGERRDRIEKRGEVWVVLSMTGEVLGEHDNPEAAARQLAAIEAAKAREGGGA